MAHHPLFFTPDNQHKAPGGVLKKFTTAVNKLEAMWNKAEGTNGIQLGRSVNGYPIFSLDTAALEATSLPFTFRCRREGDSVFVMRGYGQLVGTAAVALNPGAGDEFEFAWVDGESVWVEYNITTDAWTDPQSGSPSAETSTLRVYIICDMVDGLSGGILQRHLGDTVYYPKEQDKTLPFDFVFMFTGSTTDIADIPAEYGTFALCNGTDNVDGSGINLSGRFIVGVGETPTGTNKPTYPAGGTGIGVGGYNWHGAGENNHNDHMLAHSHPIEPGPIEIWFDPGAASLWAWDSSPTLVASGCACITWSGTDSAPTKMKPVSDGADWLGKHIGPNNSNADVDNRPPYYALCFIERIS